MKKIHLFSMVALGLLGCQQLNDSTLSANFDCVDHYSSDKNRLACETGVKFANEELVHANIKTNPRIVSIVLKKAYSRCENQYGFVSSDRSACKKGVYFLKNHIVQHLN
jgi:hypothetical protein